MSIAMATIMLVSLCAVVSTTSVSAAPSGSANAKASDPTRTSVSAAPSSSVRAAPSGSAPDGVSRSASDNAITSNPASTSVNTAVSSSANAQSALVGAPAGIVGDPAVCAQDSNSYDLFVRGTDNALWWRHEAGGTWGSWVSLGGILTSSPGAASPASGVIIVAVRGTTGALYSKNTFDGGTIWSGWANIGGQLLKDTGPAVVVTDSTSIIVAVVGTNHQLYYTSTGSSWTNLGGYLTSSPGAASPASGFITVAARGTNGALYYRSTTDGGANWTPWISLGGQLLAGTGPAVYFMSGSGTGAFVTGTNHHLYWFHGGWQPSLGGYLTSSPAAVSHNAGVVISFVVGTRSDIWYIFTTDGGTSWNPWYNLPA